MKHWAIISGEMSEVIRILDDGSGPTEYWREVVWAEAATKRDAIEVGVKVMKEWPRYARRDLDISPYAQVTAELAVCEHGFCWCELPWCDFTEDACDACIDEAE